jgi:Zn-dependent protease with chaperone function
MDFFQAQDNALKKTKQLVFYYLIAVILIIIAVYFAVVAGFMTYAELTRPEGAPSRIMEVQIWDPNRMIIVAVGVILWVGLGSLFRILSLRGGGATVARSLGGDKVDRSTRDPKRKQLLNVVEEMAIASGVPIPEVYILNGEASINAFAAGWSTDDAVIAVSAGALEKLSRDELQGVVAHEYSHVLYGDCRLNIRLMGILFGIMMLSVFGRLMGSGLRGGSRSRGVVIVPRGGGGKGGGKGKGGAVILAVIVVIILITIIGYIGTFFARLIQAAISRQREFLADAAAVQFTRNPEGIAGALKKIAVDSDHAVLANPKASEAAHMFFADGLKRPFSSVMATHPPLDLRIRSILPNWDGSFKPEKAVQREIAQAEPAPTARSPLPVGADFIGGMTILGAIGTMNQENLETAREITSAIPVALDEAMRQPEGARLVILGLLIAYDKEDDAAQWPLVEASLPGEEAAAVRQIVQSIKELPQKALLGVLELASTTLAQSMKEGHEASYALVDQLIEADEKVSLYEFCVRRIVRERLTRGTRNPADEASVRYMDLKPEVASAVSNILSVVVRETSGSSSPNELLQKALQGLYLLQGKVSYLSQEEAGIGQLDESIDVLRVSAFAIRSQCLRAIVASIKADGQLSPSEARILRMLCLSLNCPVPPIEF